MRKSAVVLVGVAAILATGAAVWQGENFVISAGTAPHSYVTYLDIAEIAAPANPAAGTRRIFVDEARRERRTVGENGERDQDREG